MGKLLKGVLLAYAPVLIEGGFKVAKRAAQKAIEKLAKPKSPT